MFDKTFSIMHVGSKTRRTGAGSIAKTKVSTNRKLTNRHASAFDVFDIYL